MSKKSKPTFLRSFAETFADALEGENASKYDSNFDEVADLLR